MNSDKLDLILDKLEKIEKKVDSIRDESPEEKLGIKEENSEGTSQPVNKKELEQVKEQFKEEVERERAKFKQERRKLFRKKLKTEEQNLVISNENLPKTWASLLRGVNKEISPSIFESHFLSLTPIAFVENTLVVEVPNKIRQEWLEDYYLDLLEVAIHELTGEEIKFKFGTPDSEIVKGLT